MAAITSDRPSIEAALQRLCERARGAWPNSVLIPSPVVKASLTAIPSTTTKEELSRLHELQSLLATRSLSPAEKLRFLHPMELTARLRQWQWNVPAAAAAWQQSLDWWRAEKLSDLSSAVVQLSGNTGGMYRKGFDCAARPCLYIRTRNIAWNGLDQLKKLVLFSVERLIASIPQFVKKDKHHALSDVRPMPPGDSDFPLHGSFVPDGRFIIIVDLLETPWTAISLPWIGEMANLVIAHYPERVRHFYIFNCGLLMNAAWYFLKPILPIATQKKIHFDDAGNLCIQADQRENWFAGGTIEPPYFDPDLYWEAEQLYDQLHDCDL